MATLVGTYTFVDNGADMKIYLGITGTAEDANLECWFDTAVELGDLYLGNDFTDKDTGADIIHPKRIIVGIYEFVRVFRQQLKIELGFGNIKEGDVQIGYLLSLIRDYFQAPLPPNVRGFWFPSKKCLMR